MTVFFFGIMVRRPDVKIMSLTVEADNGVDAVKVHLVFISQRLNECSVNRTAPAVVGLERELFTLVLKH